MFFCLAWQNAHSHMKKPSGKERYDAPGWKADKKCQRRLVGVPDRRARGEDLDNLVEFDGSS
jgi:hypothetical protein